MNVPYLQYAYGGIVPARSGLNHPTIAPYGAYPCADGKPILFSIQNEREWLALCRDVLGDEAIATDSRFSDNMARVNNRVALDAIVVAAFARHDREGMAARLEAAKIAYGRVSSLEDLMTHPQNRMIEVDTPAGRKAMLAPGALHDGIVPQFGPVPALGAHTAKIRQEFG
jgi:crotonobetainyl-CoA:carnitine CoA-transferase CaiB-like acyl-CoA transferase